MTIAQTLQLGGIENAEIEAGWILKYAEQNDIPDIVRRRVNGEPLQYLLGEWEFYGLPMKVGEGVLIPRPETELLAQLTIDSGQLTVDSTVLDLCAGSGCVGITLAKKIGCKVTAVEMSKDAIKYLHQNIKLNGVEDLVEVVESDIFDKQIDADCILINPPYLSTAEMNNLQTELTYEPPEALFGGSDGLMFYRKFFNTWGERIKQSCLFACEIGETQSIAVQRMMENIGLNPLVKQDYNKKDRIIYSIKEK